MKKITLSNIKDYILAHKNMLLMELGEKPEFYKEQIAYRATICESTCGVKRECEYCGCKFPAKLFSDKSCNNDERFPDIMEEEEWNQFKKDNGIL